MQTLSIFIKYSLLSILFLTSCNKSESSYIPLQASAISNGILISLHDASGKDLIQEMTQANDISIYGKLSKKQLPYNVKKIKIQDTEYNYISFAADLPDIKDLLFNADKTEATGTSTVEIKFNGQTITLLCSYKYTASKELNVIGNSAIVIESIECMDKIIKRNNETIITHMILNFTLDNSKLTVN